MADKDIKLSSCGKSAATGCTCFFMGPGPGDVRPDHDADCPVRLRRAVKPSENLGMDTPWPLSDVLAKLIEATEHLLDTHGCDTHGHEAFRTAAVRGKGYLDEMRRDGKRTERTP